MTDVREDFIDYPTGWELQRAGLQHVTLACSAVPPDQGGSPLGGPGFLCDCAALPYAWVERCVAQRVARGEDEETARTDQMARAKPYLVAGP